MYGTQLVGAAGIHEEVRDDHTTMWTLRVPQRYVIFSDHNCIMIIDMRRHKVFYLWETGWFDQYHISDIHRHTERPLFMHVVMERSADRGYRYSPLASQRHYGLMLHACHYLQAHGRFPRTQEQAKEHARRIVALRTQYLTPQLTLVK